MTPKEFKAAIEKLKLEPRQAALFLGMTPRHIYRIIRGDWPVPQTAVMLLRVMLKYGITPNEAARSIGKLPLPSFSKRIPLPSAVPSSRS